MLKFRIAAILAMAFLPVSGAFAETVTITDIAGRTIEVEAPVKRVILGEGRFLPTIGILDREDPTARIVGTMGDFEKLDPATYAQYLKAFPSVGDIPRMGSASESTFSVETAIAAKPDLAIFGYSSGHGPGARSVEVIGQLQAAGVPVLVVDFRMEPLLNTPKSIRLLAKAFGREAEAEEFLDFYDQELDRVASRLKNVVSRPSVFMELHVGLREACCSAMGDALMGRFITFAGGRNAFEGKIPGVAGTVSVEDILAADPDIYIGTAIGNMPRTKESGRRIILGTGADEDTGEATLAHALDRSGLENMRPVQSGRAYGIWHHFYNTPMSVAAIQAMAKWFHPDTFADLEPRKTLETYFERFQPVALDGQFWTGLPE